jgi:hypothetical protein
LPAGNESVPDMDLKALPFRSPLSAFEQQAGELLGSHRAADPAAIDLFHRKHPRFLDEKIKWLPKAIPDSEIGDAALTLDDARLTIARYYDFLDWSSLVAWVEAISQEGAVSEFESAVQAVVNGDLAALQDALRRAPRLVGARSNRVCCTTSLPTASKHIARRRRPMPSRLPARFSRPTPSPTPSPTCMAASAPP